MVFPERKLGGVMGKMREIWGMGNATGNDETSREVKNMCQGCRVLVSGDGVMALLSSQTWEASVWEAGQAGTWGSCGKFTEHTSLQLLTVGNIQ